MFCCLLPVHCNHEQDTPFPQSGTSGKQFQIVKSIPAKLQKVKGIRIQFFASNYQNRRLRKLSACDPDFSGGGLANTNITFRYSHFEVLFLLLTIGAIATASTGMFNNGEPDIGCEALFVEI